MRSFFGIALLLAGSFFGWSLRGAPQLRWYASRASVVCTDVPASGAVLCSRDFVHTNYPWFNTPVGRADVLLPGFTPLRTKGASVEAVGRRCAFANGLPSQVWSLGRQILARPVALSGVPRVGFADVSRRAGMRPVLCRGSRR